MSGAGKGHLSCRINNCIRSILLLIALVLTLFACSNPMLTELMGQIEDDVAITVAGTAPVMKSASLAADVVDVPTSVVLTAEFEVDMDPLSITSETVLLHKMPDETVVSAVVSYDAETKTISLDPSSYLEREVLYRFTITTGVKSLQGAALGDDIVRSFTTRYFHDNEIGINLLYSSNDLFLTEDKPIYMVVWPYPLQYPFNPDTLYVLSDYAFTSSGKIAIPSSALPENCSGGMIRFFHDIDGDFVPGSGGESSDSDDSEFWYSSTGAGNLLSDVDGLMIIPDEATGSWFVDADGVVIPVYGDVDWDGDGENDKGEPMSEPAYYNMNTDLVATVGNGYTVQYTDGSPFEKDPYETLDVTPQNGRPITHGTYENARNIHSLTDIDYFKFTPASSDVYEIRVKARNSDLDLNFDIKVGLYDNDSNLYTGSSSMSESSGTTTRVINSGGTFLTGGNEYYIRVEGTSGGMGEYDIGYFYKPADADSAEDDDDSTDTAPVLPFGRTNVLTRTMEAGWDTDYFAVDFVNGWNYIVEVVEDPTYFHASAESRNIELNLTLIRNGSGITTPKLDNNSMIIPATDDYNYPDDDTYYIRIENNSTTIGTENDKPSGQYKILLTYGPDSTDQTDDPAPSGSSSYVYAGTKGIGKTIYSTIDGESPQDDVDWISFSVSNIYSEYIFKTEPVSGEDGVIVNYEIYQSDINGDPDIGTVKSSSGSWQSDSSIRGSFIYPLTLRTYVDDSNPTMYERKWWVKVIRDSSYSGNALTGGYKFYFSAGADDEDSYYSNSPLPITTDAIVDVYAGTSGEGNVVYSGGIDETPWIGKVSTDTFAADLSTRNELTWTDSGGDDQINSFYRSLYRKDYGGFNTYGAEGDGETDKGSDYDFFWFQAPSRIGSSFDMVIYCRSKYAFPIKISMWVVPSADWTGLTSDRYISEADLNSNYTATTYSTSYNVYETDMEKLEQQNITGFATDDYLFFKFEIDDTRGASYTDNDGITIHNYVDSGEYQIWMLE